MAIEQKKPPKERLPGIGLVKRALYNTWALKVKQRDGWKCLLCPETENLTAHHWYVSDHHAHAARYSTANGATLCYACHIRSIHTRADYVTVNRLYDAIPGSAHISFASLNALVDTDLTIPLLRSMWDAMRSHPVELDEYDVTVTGKGKKLFLTVESDHPVAVVGNTVYAPGHGVCEILVATPIPASTVNGPITRRACQRYTIKQLGGISHADLPL